MFSRPIKTLSLNPCDTTLGVRNFLDRTRQNEPPVELNEESPSVKAIFRLLGWFRHHSRKSCL